MNAHYVPWDREEISFVISALRDIGVRVVDMKADGARLTLVVESPAVQS